MSQAAQDSQDILVSTGSRLHFGLTRVRPCPTACIRGVGVMIQSPQTELRIRPARAFRCSSGTRIEEFARAWSREFRQPLPPCEIQLTRQPPNHSGFGSGTQLAQAVACGLHRFLGLVETPGHPLVCQVAAHLDRGQRSMVGSFGFAHGGLVVDGQDATGQSILVRHQPLPSTWRVVLVTPVQANKTFGAQEKAAFDQLSTDQERRGQQLEHLLTSAMLPALEIGDFDTFSRTVFEYGKLSGEYYAKVQGGVYNGPVITAVVDTLRQLGAQGVGQSSWGPAVFAWCQDPSRANHLMQRVRDRLGRRVEIRSSPVRNQPALVSVCANSRNLPSL